MAEAKKSELNLDSIIAGSNTAAELFNGILKEVGINALSGKGGIGTLDTHSQDKKDEKMLATYKQTFSKSIDTSIFEDPRKLMKAIDASTRYNYIISGDAAPDSRLPIFKSALKEIYGITDYTTKGFVPPYDSKGKANIPND